MQDKIHEVMDRWKSLSSRHMWDQHFQELAENMLPGAARFTSTFQPGAKLTSGIYDGSPLRAVRDLVSALGGLLRPRNATWLKIKCADDGLAKRGDVKEWFEQATEIQRTEMYRPAARLTQSAGETDRSLVVFGTGVLFSGESHDMQSLLYRSYPLWDSYIAEGPDGNVNTLYASLGLTAGQAVAKYGRDNVGKALAEIAERDKEAPSKIIIAVQPRGERNPYLSTAVNMAFSYCVVDTLSEKILEEGGFHEFPFSVPRWDTMAGETYGRSPGMMALPDAKTLQQQGKTILRKGQMQVDPPVLVAQGTNVVKARGLEPGRWISYNTQKIGDQGLSDPLRPVDLGGNLVVGLEMQQDSRDQVLSAFFKDIFNLPIDGPQMTATEVIQRREEFIRVMSPIFGMLESDYTAPLAERSFAMLSRAGKFPPPPRILVEAEMMNPGKVVSFELASPIEEARKKIEAKASEETLNSLGPLVANDPFIMDNFNGDEIARSTATATGMPSKFLRSEDDVKSIRERRAAAAQAQAQAEAVQ